MTGILLIDINYIMQNTKTQLIELYEKIESKGNLYALKEEEVRIWVSKHVTLILTRTCDKACPHCLCTLNNRNEVFDFEKIETILKELSSKWASSLSISWWEPFMYMQDFPKFFALIEKYGLKIKSIKTNMYGTENENYESDFFKSLWDKNIFLQWIEPSLDRFHGNKRQLQSLKKIIDINAKLIKNSKLVEKRFMNISMIRELRHGKDIENTMKIVHFLNENYHIALHTNNFAEKNTILLSTSDIENYITNNISQDYFTFELIKWNHSLFVRFWLNDLYKIGKAEQLQSNIKERILDKDTSFSELYRYPSYDISWVDYEGNIYIDEFSAYTWRFSLGKIDDGLDSFIEKNKSNPILIELEKNGLQRLYPILLNLYPELEGFEFVVYDDIFQKIFSLKDSHKVFYALCYYLQQKK